MLAADWLALPRQFGTIFYSIVFPMLLLAGVGFFVQRRMKLDMATITRLNFYFVIPGMIFYAVVHSEISPEQIGTAVLFHVAMIGAMLAVALLAARLRGVPRDQRSALMMTAFSYNSGNYGLPLQDMAFAKSGQSPEAISLQSFVMITQNVANFTLGVWLAASGRGQRHWKENLLHIAKFPPLYVLAIALLTVQARAWLGEGADGLAPVVAPFWKVIGYIKEAFVAVALFTLGAQLATVRPDGNHYPVKLSVFVRLLVGPAVGLGLVWAFGLSGLVAQVMLISTATPTAVNCMLMCMEFDNHPNFAARSVFYSTLLSPVTVTLVIYLAQETPLLKG